MSILKRLKMILIFTTTFFLIQSAFGQETRLLDSIKSRDDLHQENIKTEVNKLSTTPLIQHLVMFQLESIKSGTQFRFTFSPMIIFKDEQILEHILDQYPDGFKVPTKNGELQFLGLEFFLSEWERNFQKIGGKISSLFSNSHGRNEFYRRFILELAYFHQRTVGVDYANPESVFFNRIESDSRSLFNGYVAINKFFRTQENFNRDFLIFIKRQMKKRAPQSRIKMSPYQELLAQSFSNEDFKSMLSHQIYAPLIFKNDPLRNHILFHFGSIGTFNYYRESLWIKMGGLPSKKLPSRLSKSELLEKIVQKLQLTKREDRSFLNWKDISSMKDISIGDIQAHFGYLEALNQYLHQKGIITKKKAKGPYLYQSANLKSPLISSEQSQYIEEAKFKIEQDKGTTLRLAQLSTNDLYHSLVTEYEKIESTFNSFKKFIEVLNDHLAKPISKVYPELTWTQNYVIELALVDLQKQYPMDKLKMFSGFQSRYPENDFYINFESPLLIRSGFNIDDLSLYTKQLFQKRESISLCGNALKSS